ncbi:MAG TPA: zf-HC2 domain-containing protein [Propionibacteriaceae bacterium]|nr:zf-HC2 domain-containing protein [Propionibacteriaceae bacterium]
MNAIPDKFAQRDAIPDKFAQWDAAYVLGALSPAERREFEEHLAGCPTCRESVSELAAIPGLLAQVSPADAAMLPLGDDSAAEYTETPASGAAPAEVIEGPPASLLPKMIKKVRAQRRRMVAAVAGIAAAVLLVIGGIAVGTGLLPLGPDDPDRLAFTPVVPSAITAIADIIPVQEGTQIKVECVYAEVNDPRPGGGHETYSIFVVDRSGHASEIKEWPATPNKQMRPSGTTPLRPPEIADLEIRQSDTNEVLLRAPLR